MSSKGAHDCECLYSSHEKPGNKTMFQCSKIKDPKFYFKAFFDFIGIFLPPKVTRYTVIKFIVSQAIHINLDGGIYFNL